MPEPPGGEAHPSGGSKGIFRKHAALIWIAAPDHYGMITLNSSAELASP
jgi:hypothetical protein